MEVFEVFYNDQIIEQFDTNQDKEISFSEFKNMIKFLNSKILEEDIMEIFKNIESNNSGKITL